jgi:hypothetical protein
VHTADSATLVLTAPDGEKTIRCPISKESMRRVRKLNWRWNEKTQNVISTQGDISLGRYILKIKKNTHNALAIHHLNEDVKDFRKENLTLIPLNLTRLYKPKHKKYRGVYKLPNGKFLAKIFLNKKQYHLGVFVDEAEAARAYNAKAKELYGPLAVLNNV